MKVKSHTMIFNENSNPYRYYVHFEIIIPKKPMYTSKKSIHESPFTPLWLFLPNHKLKYRSIRIGQWIAVHKEDNSIHRRN